MGLPYEIVPVGLSHCQEYIDSVVLTWRHEYQKKLLVNYSYLTRTYNPGTQNVLV